MEKLPGGALGTAINGCLHREFLIQRKDITATVEEFIVGRKHKSESKNGKWSKMCGDYAYKLTIDWAQHSGPSFFGHSTPAKALTLSAALLRGSTTESANPRPGHV